MANTFEPILDSGLRSINFFNGRLLSAEDLTLEQAAQRQERQWLGQALGDGVANGLEVAETVGVSTPTVPVFTVKAGLAVNRSGQALYLKKDTDLSIVRPRNGATTTADTVAFRECDPLKEGEYVAGKGLYLLTISPTTTDEGRAQVSGLGNVAAACNIRYTVASVQFNLIQVPVAASDVSDLKRARNRLAYKCFGAADAKVTGFFANPFGPLVEGYGLLDELRPNKCLTDDDVPLALLYYTNASLQFLDMWSVRRRITRRTADAAWPLLTSDRRASEAEAMFLQFQDQIEEMRVKETGLSTVAATARFDYLPPAGLLPVKGTGSPGGFEASKFFGNLAPSQIDTTDAALLPHLIRESFTHQPFALGDTSSGNLALYFIRENVDAVKSGASSQLVVVFARHALAYCGMARFNYAVWDASHFA